ncbi:MAG: hypothetical protein JW982_15165 [Spirochaetes bacterium]|nr:hypothetical protein [Spirochaetota bacterium]
MKELIKLGIIEEITNNTTLQKGEVVRRISAEKDLQACFMMYDESGDPVVANVIDMKNCGFAAEAGILKIGNNDKFYRFIKTFSNCPTSGKAKEILEEWPLYKKNRDMRKSMLNFMMMSYAPMQILDFKNTSNMKFLFIPIQQKFRIGSSEEKINWNKVRKDKFTEQIAGLKAGEHITYIAFIPANNSHSPLFYSVGTKPHETTHASLRSEVFIFEPTHGGHIKAVQTENGSLKYLVDAGSSYLGRGAATSLVKAEDVVKALKRIYPDLVFTALPGREAFGTGQSY